MCAVIVEKSARLRVTVSLVSDILLEELFFVGQSHTNWLIFPGWKYFEIGRYPQSKYTAPPF